MTLNRFMGAQPSGRHNEVIVIALLFNLDYFSVLILVILVILGNLVNPGKQS